jgi:vacuolar-type H+-ATPase subunit E/Vma4
MSDQPQSIKDFCERIDEDAEKEITSILERAEYTAKARTKQILDDAEEKKKTILDKGAEEAKSARRLVLSDLNLELKKVGLRIKGEIVEDAMSMLRQRLSELRSSPEYIDFLTWLSFEGITILGLKEVVLKPGEFDKSFFTESLLDGVRKRLSESSGNDVRISITGEALKGSSGLIIASKDGRLLYDNTIESRIGRMSDELHLIISRKIFG